MIAETAFKLASKPFSEPHDFRVFGHRGHSLVSELLEDIMPNGLEKLPRPAMAGDGHMQIDRLEAIEHTSADDFAALLDAKAGKWREKPYSDPVADEADHSIVCHDHDRISPWS
jgi:hypothetical protein